jgi:hypothetical protein
MGKLTCIMCQTRDEKLGAIYKLPSIVWKKRKVSQAARLVWKTEKDMFAFEHTLIRRQFWCKPENNVVPLKDDKENETNLSLTM